VEQGTLKELDRSRYWAQKTGKAPTITGGNLRLVGQGQSLEQLIKGVERGLLVSHIWYVRSLDAQQLSVTGLTRDATFLIEGGKVSKPVKNFRLNVSLLEVLKNVEATGVEEQLAYLGVAPAVRVRDFFMSSLSEAI
jgi:predicted Zn-dependent protease